MIIEPKIRSFICITAHPEGCASNVQKEIDYIKAQGSVDGPKKVLVIGASTGYGLASRIACAYGSNAATIGVFYERPAAGKRTATAGWYNTVAFEKAAHADNLYAKSINGDAFSHEVKQQTIDLIKQDLGKVDLVIYSVAAPRRLDPDSGEVYHSTLKTIGEPFSDRTINLLNGELSEIDIPVANTQDIQDTIAVMGGADWTLWMEALKAADVLAENVKTLSYSYIGPKTTYPIYRAGTIGRAKEHMEASAATITEQLADLNGQAYVSVNKAVVTQASAAIPIVPLYMAILFKVMKEKDCHEDCIEQMYRLLNEKVYSGHGVKTDEHNLIRLDDWELREDVQQQVQEYWQQINDDNLHQLSDFKEYQQSFYRLFGFELAGVDYQADLDPNIDIPSLAETTTA